MDARSDKVDGGRQVVFVCVVFAFPDTPCEVGKDELTDIKI